MVYNAGIEITADCELESMYICPLNNLLDCRAAEQNDFLRGEWRGVEEPKLSVG